MHSFLISRLRPLTWALALTLLTGLPPVAAQPPGSAAALASHPESVLQVSSGPAGPVTAGEVELMVDDLVPQSDRQTFWRSTDAVSRFARGLTVQRALAAAAVQAGLGQNAAPSAAARLLRERELTELYLQRQVAQAMPDAAAIEQFGRSGADQGAAHSGAGGGRWQ